jgi:uncharacterized membrane protein YccF (DUF307 family)
MAVGWLLAAVIMAVTIVGIPWARAALNMAVYTLMPFGHTAVDREEFAGRPSVGTGPLGVVGCQSAWERDPGSACKRDPL